MPHPCQDAYSITFTTLDEQMRYHQDQAAASQWERVPINRLEIAPLDTSSPLFGDASLFAAGVTPTAIEDTAENLGLAIRFDSGRGYYPLRDTAYKSLLDRAKITGTVLSKLGRDALATILNTCLAVYSREALLLIRDEKAAAVHSGDLVDYAILPINELLTQLQTKLGERFPEYTFASGYSDHAQTSVSVTMPKQTEELLDVYRAALVAHGMVGIADKLTAGLRFSTSDAGLSSAKVSGLLLGLQMPIQIGDMAAIDHRGVNRKPEDFAATMDDVFVRFSDFTTKLTSLMDVVLEYPVNAMTAIAKKLRLPKKAALEAIAMFEASYGGSTSTAHDVFFALQEVPYILKTESTPQSKIFVSDEAIAKTVNLRWSDYDLAKAVRW